MNNSRTLIYDLIDNEAAPFLRLLNLLEANDKLMQLADKILQLSDQEFFELNQKSYLQQESSEPVDNINDTEYPHRVYDDDWNHQKSWEKIKRIVWKDQPPEFKQAIKDRLEADVQLLKRVDGSRRKNRTLNAIADSLEASTYFYRVLLSGRSADRLPRKDKLRMWLMENIEIVKLYLNYEDRERLFLLTVEEKRAKYDRAIEANAQSLRAHQVTKAAKYRRRSGVR